MLAVTGLRAVAVDAATYRLERVPKPKPRRAPVDRAERKLAREERPAADIIVTASKRPQHLSTVPGSLSVVTPDRIATGIVSPDSQTISTGVDGLAITNLGPGRNRQFIRGVADSPFNGPSQSTVAIALDNSRITYDAPDPDLLLVDVDRVEVLKGPQGPLYGSGALGGIFHIVSNAPVDDAAFGSATVIGEGVSHGGIGGGIDGMLNVPIGSGLAVRGVGYVRSDAGWLDTIGGASGTNRVKTSGGRLALRWTPDADWQIDLGGVLQSLNADDSQYVTGSAGTLKRIHPIAEPADNDFAQAHLDIRGRIGGLRLLSATSYVAQAVDYRLDASASAALFGLSAPAVFDDRRRYTIFNQELRLSPQSAGRIDWLAGLSYLHASSSLDGSMSGSGATPLAVETIDQDVSEYAAFGEASAPIGPFTITAGARLFATDAADERVEQPGTRKRTRRKIGFSPSLSASWQPSKGSYFFLRYARALRPGGLAAGSGVTQGHYESDELESLELGARLAPDGSRLALNGSIYYTNWKDVQSDYLLPDGLISTRNAGRARIIGGDASIDWSAGGGWTLSAGINAEQAELVAQPDGVKLDDLRLPVAPDLTLRGQLGYRFDVHGWTLRAIGQGNYVGGARLSFDPDLDRDMGHYAVFAAALTARRAPWSVTARIDNVFDIAGDSFAFGNPFSIRLQPQYTPLQPRTLTVSIGYDW